jgi:hypothetical protein
LWKWYGRERSKQRYSGRGDELRRGLVTQMAVGAVRVIDRALVMPIADDARGENQQDDERQRNPK